MIIRKYSELIRLNTFEDRFEYLRLFGRVGSDTFGFDRYVNQAFYRSKEWKNVRNEVIVRDFGCDLAIPGREIGDRIIVHHMNPINIDDIEYASDYILNPEFLICVSNNTHEAIHYGDINLAKRFDYIERKANDTCPWK